MLSTLSYGWLTFRRDPLFVLKWVRSITSIFSFYSVTETIKVVCSFISAATSTTLHFVGFLSSKISKLTKSLFVRLGKKMDVLFSVYSILFHTTPDICPLMSQVHCTEMSSFSVYLHCTALHCTMHCTVLH